MGSREKNTSSGSKGGTQGTRAPPSGPKFLHFHAVFTKNWPNNELAPPLFLEPPFMGNPGSATGYSVPFANPCDAALLLSTFNWIILCFLCRYAQEVYWSFRKADRQWGWQLSGKPTDKEGKGRDQNRKYKHPESQSSATFRQDAVRTIWLTGTDVTRLYEVRYAGNDTKFQKFWIRHHGLPTFSPWQRVNPRIQWCLLLIEYFHKCILKRLFVL